MDLKDQLTQARAILNRTEKISIPREVIKLHQILNTQEFPNPDVITDLIGQNTLLAGEVVQTANLPSIQGEHFRTINTIRDAIDILGLRRLKNLITAIALKQNIANFSNKTITDHSVKVAQTAAEIAKNTDAASTDEAYLLGLFHNIGAIIMTKVDPSYETIFTKSLSHPYSTDELEIEKYKTTHGMVGVLVAEEWNLSTPFKKTMIMHHESELTVIKNPELQQLVALIQLANAMVSERFFRVYKTPELCLSIDNSVEILGLEEEQINTIRQAM